MHKKSYACYAWVAAFAWCSTTLAYQPYQSAWEAKYATSTLPGRMDAQTGSSCNICHHPIQTNTQGNCYRVDIKTLMDGGDTIAQAIDNLDAVDSDGDGVPNGVEATMPHASLPGEIGYNQGLIGPTGTDPCGADPEAAVTGVSETPPEMPIPTVSEWGILVMALMVLAAGTLVFRSPR